MCALRDGGNPGWMLDSGDFGYASVKGTTAEIILGYVLIVIM